MVSPGRESTQPGLSFSDKRTRKPNSVYAVIPLGGALPLALISDLPGGFGNCSSRLAASGRCAAEAWLLAPASLPIWSCSVWGLPCRWHYCRRGALLPHLFTLTTAWGSLLDEILRRTSVPIQRAAPRSGGMFSVALAVLSPLPLVPSLPFSLIPCLSHTGSGFLSG